MIYDIKPFFWWVLPIKVFVYLNFKLMPLSSVLPLFVSSFNGFFITTVVKLRGQEPAIQYILDLSKH